MARISGQSDRDGALIALGEAVRGRRKASGMSQEALADAAGIDRSHMGKIERGEHLPSLALILKIATALKMSGTDLMAATERNMDSTVES